MPPFVRRLVVNAWLLLAVLDVTDLEPPPFSRAVVWLAVRFVSQWVAMVLVAGGRRKLEVGLARLLVAELLLANAVAVVAFMVAYARII